MDSESAQATIKSQINTISWSQIPATDISRAEKFYSTIFNWAFDNPLTGSAACGEAVSSDPHDDLKTSETIFSMFSFPGNPLPQGGLCKVKAENHVSPALVDGNEKKDKMTVNVTITVKSIDETLPRIVEAGGVVYMEKMEIPNGMGFCAFFLDTEKNVMGLWSQN